jgi:hypothetical protein
MNYIISEIAMKHLTLAQVKALASLDGWKADEIIVGVDYTISSKSDDDNRWMYAIARNNKWMSNIMVFGISPDGAIHS